MKVHDLQDGQVVKARFGRYVSTMDQAEYDPRRDYSPADPRVPYPAHMEIEGLE